MYMNIIITLRPRLLPDPGLNYAEGACDIYTKLGCMGMIIDIYRRDHHYTNLTFVSECVCESGRSTEAIRPEIKTNL